MKIRRHTIHLFTYAAAILGGLALVVGFARFNTLNDEFLGANFDSVHGARTLLKAGYLLELAAKDVENAIVDGDRRPTLLAYAANNLALAESYGAEGRDNDPAVRAALASRIQTLRSRLSAHREAPGTADVQREYAPTLAAIRQLAKDFSTAELERWSTLSSANAALVERMAQLRLFILAAIVIFLLIMAALGWSLARMRRTERDLLRAKGEIEAIQKSTLDASPLGIAFTDTTDLACRHVKLANRQMALIFGYPPEQLPGLETSRLYADPQTYERMNETLPARLSAGEVVREEVLMQRQNGEHFWCSLSIKAIDAGSLASGVVWTCEDIGERRKAQVALQLAVEKAETASLAKSEFLANMSHELRTPFAGILGLLDLLQRTELSDAQQRYTNLARDSTSQMLSIVNDILDFSKIEAGRLSLDPVDFDLRQFFSALAETHASEAMRKGLSFTLYFIEPLPLALAGDPVRIRQIVDNLLSNAIKFTMKGRVELRIECTPTNAGSATLSIAVSDTGIGLPADMQEHIFQKFTQADTSTTRLFGGTGLGLAICQQLAALMGARVKVNSVLGEGSRFHLAINLPLVPDFSPALRKISTDAADSAAAIERQPVGRPGTVVLLVDDNATNRSVFAELLCQYGYLVKLAENGEQAIRLAGEIRPDIILMDCQMPVIDGQEATRRIRAAEAPGEHVAIIALTAHATNCDRESCLASGMDDYLPKPFSPASLVRKIAQWTADRKLPPENAIPQPEIPANPPAKERRSGRILLVEDNPAIQEATRQLIQYAGYEVAVAAHGQAALDSLEAALGAHPFDLVLMDCKMPVMDGWETTRRWRQRERENGLQPVTIIAVTGCERTETRQDCHAAGMDGILVKPYPVSSLTKLLAERLGSKPIGDGAAEDPQRA